MSEAFIISEDLKELIVDAREIKTKKIINSLSLALMTHLEAGSEFKKRQYSKLPLPLLEILIQSTDSKTPENLDLLALKLLEYRNGLSSLTEPNEISPTVDTALEISRMPTRHGASSETSIQPTFPKAREELKLESIKEDSRKSSADHSHIRLVFDGDDLEEMKETLLYLAANAKNRPELNGKTSEEVTLAQALTYLTADSHPLYSEDFTSRIYKLRSTWFRISLRPLKSLIASEERLNRKGGLSDVFADD